MKQIAQKLKTGQMRVIEVPVPSLQKGCLLVKTPISARILTVIPYKNIGSPSGSKIELDAIEP